MLISWISNVSGRLFFNLTDPYSYRMDRIIGDVIHLNKQENNTRYLFTSVLVDLRDEAIENSTVFTRIVLWAKATVNDDELPKSFEGAIYFFDDPAYPKLNKSNDERKIVTQFNTLAKDNKPEELLDELTKLVQLYEEDKDKIIDKVNFKIYANGIIELEQSKLWSTHSQEEKSPTIKQAFYFIKFIFHKDRFHLQSNEGIIRIINAPKSFDDLNSTEIVKITEELLVGIKRYIAESRKLNSKNPLVLQQLKGVLVYANSLITIIESVLTNNDATNEKELKIIANERNLFKNVDASIDMELTQKPSRSVNIYQFISELQVWSMIGLAILGPIIVITFQTTLHEVKNSESKIEFGNILNHYIRDVLLPYYGTWFLVAVILVVLVKWLYDRTFKSAYLLTVVNSIWMNFIYITRKLSKPNIKSNNLLSILSSQFIALEMWIRRGKDSLKILIGIAAIACTIGIYGILGHYYPDKISSTVEKVSKYFKVFENKK